MTLISYTRIQYKCQSLITHKTLMVFIYFSNKNYILHRLHNNLLTLHIHADVQFNGIHISKNILRCVFCAAMQSGLPDNTEKVEN